MTHLMVDIETLGTRPGAVILAVAFVRFSDEAHTTLNLSIPDQEALGLEKDPDTMAWWQGQEAQHPGAYGRYWWQGKHHIEISVHGVAHSITLIEKLSHEMIHLHLEELGMDSRGDAYTHNGAFRKLAADVCKVHGFDPKAFY